MGLYHSFHSKEALGRAINVLFGNLFTWHAAATCIVFLVNNGSFSKEKQIFLSYNTIITEIGLFLVITGLLNSRPFQSMRIGLIE